MVRITLSLPPSIPPSSPTLSDATEGNKWCSIWTLIPAVMMDQNQESIHNPGSLPPSLPPYSPTLSDATEGNRWCSIWTLIPAVMMDQNQESIHNPRPLPPSLPPSLLTYLVRCHGGEQVVLNLDIDPGRDDGPEPRVDAEVGGRLDLAHTPGGRLGGRIHATGREVVRLQKDEGGREGSVYQ